MMIGRMRNAEASRRGSAELRMALIVGLQAGQDQIELLAPPSPRASAEVRGDERIGRAERIVLDVQGAVGAAAPAPRGSTCWTRAGPAEQTTTSPPCFSRAGAAPLPAHTRRARFIS